MAENVIITRQDNYILAVFEGEFSVQKGKEVIDLYVQRCRIEKVAKVLLDCYNLTGKITVMNRLSIAGYAAKHARAGIKTAILGQPNYILSDNFFENPLGAR